MLVRRRATLGAAGVVVLGLSSVSPAAALEPVTATLDAVCAVSFPAPLTQNVPVPGCLPPPGTPPPPGTSTLPGGSPSTHGGPASQPGTGSATTAAQRLGWGAPAQVDDFDAGLGGWGLYDGPGHDGRGRRSPGAISVANSVMTISGATTGTTGGMSWGTGSRYGRWEVRMRAPAADPSYNAVLLLWPDAENWPVGGEVDFAEMSDPSRRRTDAFLHYGASNDQVQGSVTIDATQWHNWAVEWTPAGIATYVDGAAWWSTTDTSILPPGSMHLCIQLDWFPEGGAVRPSRLDVDWAAFYPVTGSGAAPLPPDAMGTVTAPMFTPAAIAARTSIVLPTPTRAAG